MEVLDVVRINNCILLSFYDLLFSILSKCQRITARDLLSFIVLLTYRSSHQKYSMKEGILRNFTKFTGKHLCQSLFLNKVAGLTPATLLKKRLWHRYFPVNFVKFLRTTFLQNTSQRLLLNLDFYSIFQKVCL